jgi:hypothetical protein
MYEQYAHLTGEPSKPATPPTWSAPEPPRKKKHTFRKVVLWTVGVGVVTFTAIGVIGAATGSGTASTADPRPAPSGYNTVQPPKTDPIPDPTTGDELPAPTQEPVAPAAPAPTVAQEQALESAKSYLDMGGFSRAGLIDQLSSSAGEGFAKADAIWAVKHAHADWNEQAVLSAKSYLDMGGFSRASLIDQLSSSAGEGFTVAQATYAANQVGL